MPYTPISNLSRRGEKLAPFITVQNAVGMVALGGFGWLVASPFPGFLRFLVMALFAAVGYLVTVDVRGMSMYERVLWRLRGQFRRLLHGNAISPDDLPGTIIQAKIPVARRDGMVRLRAAPPAAVRPQTTAAAKSRLTSRRAGRPTVAVPPLPARAAARHPEPIAAAANRTAAPEPVALSEEDAVLSGQAA